MIPSTDAALHPQIIVTIWDSFHENFLSRKYIKCYKIPLHLNHYNFRKVKDIDFLFSTLHTTPFHYSKIHFGSLIFMSSVTEIQLNKVRARFRARFAPIIWANCVLLNVWEGGDYIIGGNEAGKRARTLFNCISVTDDIKINEQNNPIAKGPLYIETEFEAI